MKKAFFLIIIFMLLVACTSNQNTASTKHDQKIVFPDDIITQEKANQLEQNTETSTVCQNLVRKTAVIEGQIVRKTYFKYGGDMEVFTYLGIKTNDNCIFYFLKESNSPAGIKKFNEQITKTIGDQIRVKGLIMPKKHDIGGQLIAFYEISHPQEVSSDFRMEPQGVKCIHEPECPAGKTLIITHRYSGGLQEGCPFKWECQ